MLLSTKLLICICCTYIKEGYYKKCSECIKRREIRVGKKEIEKIGTLK